MELMFTEKFPKNAHEAFQKIRFIVMHAQMVYILMTQTK